MTLQDRKGRAINGVSSSSADTEHLARELLNSKWSVFDGPEPVLARILNGEATISSSLPTELRIDFVLGRVVHEAIRAAREEGRHEGMRDQKRLTIERLGLL